MKGPEQAVRRGPGVRASSAPATVSACLTAQPVRRMEGELYICLRRFCEEGEAESRLRTPLPSAEVRVGVRLAPPLPPLACHALERGPERTRTRAS